MVCRTNVPSDSLPYLDNVVSSVRKQILEGKLINLAILLIPNAEAGDFRTTDFNGQSYPLKEDPRLSKVLTVGEFITAFGI